ncbi:phosphatase PAP2 family protein [Streptomyces sp. NPDC059883]|uniref:phosphatase PAP2 family protein n=1 Tax=unclassified Streptomyces TaxID=2593676 RepID=UPI0036521225
MSLTEPPARRAVRTAPLIVTVLCAGAFALLAVLVTGRGGAPFPLDTDALDWSLGHRSSPAGVTAARAVTASGTGPYPYLCAVVAGLLAGRDPRHRLMAAAGALVFLLAGQAARYGLLAAVARPRPPMADWLTHASGFAFPSGHATTSALAAGLLIWGLVRFGHSAHPGRGSRVIPKWLRGALIALLVCWAVAVGLSRIYLGVHWATDVVGGWLYAAAWLGLGASFVPARSHFPAGAAPVSTRRIRRRNDR